MIYTLIVVGMALACSPTIKKAVIKVWDVATDLPGEVWGILALIIFFVSLISFLVWAGSQSEVADSNQSRLIQQSFSLSQEERLDRIKRLVQQYPNEATKDCLVRLSYDDDLVVRKEADRLLEVLRDKELKEASEREKNGH